MSYFSGACCAAYAQTGNTNVADAMLASLRTAIAALPTVEARTQAWSAIASAHLDLGNVNRALAALSDGAIPPTELIDAQVAMVEALSEPPPVAIAAQ